MKSNFFTLALLLIIILGANEVFAQQKVSVVIAYRDNNCGNRVDLGYEWFSSSAESASELKKKAKSRVISRNSDYESTESVTEYDGCSYMVVISYKGQDSDGCATNHYGVGFADDRSSALEKAKKHLKGNNWNWNSSKGFNIAEEKHF